jgi:hypothetical protein
MAHLGIGHPKNQQASCDPRSHQPGSALVPRASFVSNEGKVRTLYTDGPAVQVKTPERIRYEFDLISPYIYRMLFLYRDLALGNLQSRKQ